MSAQSLTCCTQPASAVPVGSMVSSPLRRMWSSVADIQSTCCSMDTIMFDSTDGLPGPVIREQFGKPTVVSPR
jgi:hypothetical protein